MADFTANTLKIDLDANKEKTTYIGNYLCYKFKIVFFIRSYENYTTIRNNNIEY